MNDVHDEQLNEIMRGWKSFRRRKSSTIFFFLGAFFTVNLSSRRACCLRFSAFLPAIRTDTCVAHLCELEIEKLISRISYFCRWKAELKWDEIRVIFSGFFSLLISQKWQPLELHKIGSMEEKRKRLENDSLKRLCVDEMSKYLKKSSNNTRAKKVNRADVYRSLGKKSATKKLSLRFLLELSTKAKGQISHSSS